MRRIALLLLALAAPLAAQDTPQRHQAAVVTFSNGTYNVWSIDSGGTRTVYIAAYAKSIDTVLKRSRGGTFKMPAGIAEGLANAALLVVGDTVEHKVTYPSGDVNGLTMKCLPTGCTITITNRTDAGEARAGSWTATRLSIGTTRSILEAVREAALQQTGLVFIFPAPL